MNNQLPAPSNYVEQPNLLDPSVLNSGVLDNAHNAIKVVPAFLTQYDFGQVLTQVIRTLAEHAQPNTLHMVFVNLVTRNGFRNDIFSTILQNACIIAAASTESGMCPSVQDGADASANDAYDGAFYRFIEAHSANDAIGALATPQDEADAVSIRDNLLPELNRFIDEYARVTNGFTTTKAEVMARQQQGGWNNQQPQRGYGWNNSNNQQQNCWGGGQQRPGGSGLSAIVTSGGSYNQQRSGWNSRQQNTARGGIGFPTGQGATSRHAPTAAMPQPGNNATPSNQVNVGFGSGSTHNTSAVNTQPKPQPVKDGVRIGNQVFARVVPYESDAKPANKPNPVEVSPAPAPVSKQSSEKGTNGMEVKVLYASPGVEEEVFPNSDNLGGWLESKAEKAHTVSRKEPKPAPISGGIVFDPFAYVPEGESINTDRPFDRFFNEGGITIYSMDYWLGKGIAPPRPVIAHNSYLYTGFYALHPDDTVTVHYVRTTTEMRYIDHELSRRLAGSAKRAEYKFQEDKIYMEETKQFVPVDLVPRDIEKAHVPSVDLNYITNDPRDAAATAEIELTETIDGEIQYPSNFSYDIATQSTLTAKGLGENDLVKALGKVETYNELLDILNDSKRKHELSTATFNTIDKDLTDRLNDILTINLATGIYIDSFYEDYQSALDAVEGELGEKGVKYVEETAAWMIPAVLNIVLDEDNSGKTSATFPKQEALDEATATYNALCEDENEVNKDDIVSARSKKRDLEVEKTLFEQEHAVNIYERDTRSLVLRTNLESVVFSSAVNDKVAQVLPAAEHPNLTSALKHLLKRARDEEVATVYMLTVDGALFKVAEGAFEGVMLKHV